MDNLTENRHKQQNDTILSLFPIPITTNSFTIIIHSHWIFAWGKKAKLQYMLIEDICKGRQGSN